VSGTLRSRDSGDLDITVTQSIKAATVFEPCTGYTCEVLKFTPALDDLLVCVHVDYYLS
jgi:hypothetical protein